MHHVLNYCIINGFHQLTFRLCACARLDRMNCHFRLAAGWLTACGVEGKVTCLYNYLHYLCW